tara:strand:- start:1 stop:225 length:225 start_codon:yes stop_codon:yes gene_type:complete
MDKEIEEVADAPRWSVILNSIKTAKTQQILNFIGQVVRLHKQHGADYTKDESMMSNFRDSFQQRKTELEEKNDG